MRAAIAIYARVSTSDQAERQTIESQLVACREWAAAHNYAVVGEFSDEGVSGTKPFEERPAGRRLLESARTKQIDRVLVYCPDRLARDTLEAGLAMRDFKALGVAVDFKSQSFDDTPEGVLQFQILMSFAEFERRLIARRTTQGQQRRLRAGQKGRGRDPYGYHWNPESDQFDVVPGELEIIRVVFQRYADGDSLRDIAAALSNQGLASPDGQRGHKAGAARWQHSTVHRLLTRGYYATGAMTGEFMGEAYSLPVPKIVDPELARQVKDRLEGARHFPRRLGTRGLFQGRIRCGSCGRTYRRGSYGGKQSANYFCPGRLSQTQRLDGTPKCLSPNLRMADADAALWVRVSVAIQDPQRLARDFLAGIEAEIAASPVGTAAQAELQEWREKKATAVKLLTEPEMSVEAIMETMTKLDAHVDRCERQLRGKEAELRHLEQLQTQRAELEQVVATDQRVILLVDALAPDGSVVGLGDDVALACWLETDRAILVQAAEGTEETALLGPTTADKLLDYLDVQVSIEPTDSKWAVRVAGNSLWFKTRHAALSRSSQPAVQHQVVRIPVSLPTLSLPLPVSPSRQEVLI